jgi:hypothetical protein
VYLEGCFQTVHVSPCGRLVGMVLQKAANRHLPFIIQNTVVDFEFSKECPYVCICPIQDRVNPHE